MGTSSPAASGRLRDARGHGEIRRVNINAAPLDMKATDSQGRGNRHVPDFPGDLPSRDVRGVHPAGTRKADYLWRLDGLSRPSRPAATTWHRRAVRAVRLAVRGAGPGLPRALSPEALRLRAAHDQFPAAATGVGVELDDEFQVNDHDFKRLIAILRLAVPYTGLILTARERPSSGARSWRSASRRLTPAAASRSADTPRPATRSHGARAVLTRRRPPARRGDARPDRGRIRSELLHRLLPAGPHRRAFHGVRDPRFHQALLHAQRALHADGVSGGLRHAGDARRRREGRRRRTGGDGGREIKEQLADRLRRIRETDDRDLYF